MNIRRRLVITAIVIGVFAVFFPVTYLVSKLLGIEWIFVSLPFGFLLPAVMERVLNWVLTRWPQGTYPDGTPYIGYRHEGVPQPNSEG